MKQRGSVIKSTLGLAPFVLLMRLIAAPYTPGPVAEQAATLPVLTRISDVHSLSTKEAQRGYPVHVRAVVTFFDPTPPDLFVQDESGGIWVRLTGSYKPAKAGELIELYGISEQPDFAPQISSAHWVVIGHTALPKARVVNFQQMAGASTDSQRVEIEGRVREASILHHLNSPPMLWFDVAVEGGRVHVDLPWDSAPLPADLVDAKVRVRGVSASDFNALNQLIGLGMHVATFSDIQILESSKNGLTVTKPLPIGSLSRYGTSRPFGNPEVFVGNVMADFGRRGIYIRDATGSVIVESRQDEVLTPGERVQIRGFPAFSQGHITIEDAMLTRVAKEPAPEPVRPAMARLLEGEFDSQLVQLDGSVIDFLLDRHLPAFMVRKEQTVFSVVSNSPSVLSVLPGRGSTVSVTGICITDFDRYTGRPVGFRLVVRSAKDVQILHAGPWWTAARILALVIFLGLGVALTSLWVFVLRRRVAGQTGMIRAAIESTADGIIAVDDYGRPSLWNEKFKQMWDVSEEALRRSGTFSSIREVLRGISDPDAFLTHVREVAGSNANQSDCRIDLKDGRVYECHSELQVVNGRRVGRVWSFRDVTDRIQAEARLRHRTEQQIAVSEVSQFALGETDLRAVLRRGVSTVQRFLTRGAEPLEPERMLSIVDVDQDRLTTLEARDFDGYWSSLLGHVLGARQCSDEDLLFIRSLGAVLASAFARKRIDEQLESAKNAAEAGSKAKSEFLAMMSHEIRTPMNGVIGMTKLLLESPLTEQQRDLVSTVEQSGEVLLALIADILDFSKIEAGKLELEAVTFRLRSKVLEVVRMVKEVSRQKGLKFEFLWDEAIPDLVVGDAVRLRQVLLNLAFNAVKFTEEGCICLRAIAENSSAGVTRIRFEVEDTGIGISAGAQGKLFDSFMQADRSTTRRYGGTGLGLAISKRLVEMMNGQISLQSELGKGSCFSFTVALGIGSAVTDPECSPTASRLSEDPGRTRGLKILIAEDNAVNQKVLTHMLKRGKHEIRIACDGLETIQLAETETFDLILMDCQMPGLDGFAASRYIRSGQLNRDTPIIAVTANAFAETRLECLQAGMNDHITKPISRDVLEAAIARWVPSEALV